MCVLTLEEWNLQSSPAYTLVLHKQVIYLVELLVFFLKRHELPPKSWAFHSDDHLEVSCSYLKETHACWF